VGLWLLSEFIPMSFGSHAKKVTTRARQATQDIPQHGQKPSYPKNGGRAQTLQRGAIFLGVLFFASFLFDKKKK